MLSPRAACLFFALLLVGSSSLRSRAEAPRASTRAQTPFAPTFPQSGVLTLPGAELPPRIALRELSLHKDLGALRDQARHQGWFSGAIIALGAAAISAGAVYPREAGALLFPLGVLAIERGVLSLSLASGRTGQVGQYLSLPMYTPDQVRTRIQYGEALLAYHARRARIGRMVDGSTSLLVAASYVPLSWWLEHRENPSYRFSDDGFGYAVLALSIVSAGTAVVSLFTPSPVEQRHAAHKALVEAQERESPGELQHWTAAVTINAMATKNRLTVQADYRF